MSAYSYTLIVKGSELEAGCEVKERLGGLAGVSIESATAWDHPDECVFSVAAGQDLTHTLNTWFLEDSRLFVFPVGSLLAWNTH